MKKALSILLCLVLCIGMMPAAAFASTQAPAFPGAEGAGMYVTGGRGGSVYEVTSLDDYDPLVNKAGVPGTLRYGLYANKKDVSNRTIVFRVSGTIHLKAQLKVSPKNVTIAGQTAPGDGIAIGDFNVSIGGSNNIIRYIRFRGGFAQLDDAFDVTGKSMIIDHCSFSWSTDECVSMKKVNHITFQWNIVSDSLNMSIHDKGAHGYGGIWGGAEMSFHHNLIANNSSRNPRFDRDYSTGSYFVGDSLVVDFRNNVVTNWGINTSYGGENATGINIINNYYKAGLSSFPGTEDRIVNPSTDAPGSYYIDGNYVEGYPAITQDNWNGGIQPDYGLETVNHLSQPYATSGESTNNVTTDSATVAYQKVLDSAGAILPKRDSLDARIVNDVRDGTGKIVNTPASEGGFPVLNSTAAPVDSDHDGMPDSWETANGLNPNNADDRNSLAQDGYTNLEKYMNSLTSTGSKNPTVAITSPKLNSILSSGSDIQINANAFDEDGTVSKVEFYSSDSKLGEAISAPYTYTWNNVPEGTHYLYAKAIDNSGTSTLSSMVTIHVNDAEIGAPWVSQDIGKVSIKGSGSLSQNDGVYTVKGSGQIDSENTDGTYGDTFHYVYQPVTGNALMQAQVREASDIDNNTTSGIMARSDLSTQSPFALLTISREENLGTCANFVTRTDKGTAASVQQITGITAPYYLKVVRQNNTFTGYVSSNGQNWQTVGTAQIDMPENTYLGMAVDANKDTSNYNYLHTAKFSELEFIKAPEISLNNLQNDTTNIPDYVVSGKVSGKVSDNAGSGDTGNTDTQATGTTTSLKTSTSNNFVTMTSGLNDTVTSSTYTISGTMNKNAAVTITLNDTRIVDAQTMTAGQAINQQLTFAPGRNSVVITASDASGNVDTIAYNVIYLTKYNAVVDAGTTLADGTLVNNIKTYKTIQAAVNDIPKTNASSYIIFIKNGTYNENVNITSGANFISLIGESRTGTKITSNKDLATYTRQLCATVYVKSDDFTAENITFENSYAFNFDVLPTDMRALALDVESKRAVFQNCSINARQDTLYVDTNGGDTGRQYFKNCYISGDVDFIYGPSVAVFDNCEIYSLDRFTNPNGYVTAANTPAYRQYGLVFLNSTFTSDAAAGTVYLGRPWGQDATVAYLNCYLGAHINTSGWTDMSPNTANLAHFAEYKNYGPGAVVNASRKQLTDAEAANYTISNILSVGDGWDPAAYINNLYNPVSGGSGSSSNGSNTVWLTEVLNGTTVADGIQSSINTDFALPALTLADGLNTIIVTAKDENNLTSTKTINVTYNKNAPVITLTSAPGQVVDKDAFTVTGSSSKDSVITVKLNGTAVYEQQKAANENFSTDILLNEGVNVFEVTAADQYGISSSISYSINYSKDWGTNEFSTKSVMITNADGTPVSTLNASHDLCITADFMNNAEIQKDATMVIALYDGNGNMAEASYSTVSFSAGETKTMDARFNLPGNTNGYTIKVFVWDNPMDRKLISNEIVLP